MKTDIVVSSTSDNDSTSDDSVVVGSSRLSGVGRALRRSSVISSSDSVDLRGLLDCVSVVHRAEEENIREG